MLPLVRMQKRDPSAPAPTPKAPKVGPTPKPPAAPKPPKATTTRSAATSVTIGGTSFGKSEKKMGLWRHAPAVGKWEHVREVTPETASQWKGVYERDEPTHTGSTFAATSADHPARKYTYTVATGKPRDVRKSETDHVREFALPLTAGGRVRFHSACVSGDTPKHAMVKGREATDTFSREAARSLAAKCAGCGGDLAQDPAGATKSTAHEEKWDEGGDTKVMKSENMEQDNSNLNKADIHTNPDLLSRHADRLSTHAEARSDWRGKPGGAGHTDAANRNLKAASAHHEAGMAHEIAGNDARAAEHYKAAQRHKNLAAKYKKVAKFTGKDNQTASVRELQRSELLAGARFHFARLERAQNLGKAESAATRAQNVAAYLQALGYDHRLGVPAEVQDTRGVDLTKTEYPLDRVVLGRPPRALPLVKAVDDPLGFVNTRHPEYSSKYRADGGPMPATADSVKQYLGKPSLARPLRPHEFEAMAGHINRGTKLDKLDDFSTGGGDMLAMAEDQAHIGSVGKGGGKPLDIGDGYQVHRHGMDANGNHSIWVSKGSGPTRKIQTNGNLPTVHSAHGSGRGKHELPISAQGAKEIKDYHSKYVQKPAQKSEVTMQKSFFRDYHEARAHAENQAKSLNYPHGIEATKEYGRKGFSVKMVPRDPKNRQGHELRMEIVEAPKPSIQKSENLSDIKTLPLVKLETSPAFGALSKAQDRRYRISKEYTGHASGKPQHVVRFAGDFVGSHPTREGAQAIQQKHASERDATLSGQDLDKAAPGAPGAKPRAPRPAKPHNEDNVTELRLYADNDGDLYRRQTTPIHANLANKMAGGKYDHEKAKKLFGYLADSAAQKYTKEHGTPGPNGNFGAFSPADRREVASRMADHFHVEAKLGNHDHHLQQQYQKKGVSLKNVQTNGPAPK